MSKRIYMAMIVAFLAHPAFAVTDDVELSLQRRSSSDLPILVSLTSSISETPVDPDSADHARIFAFSAALTYNLPAVQSEFLSNPSLTLSLGYSDQIDVEDNNSNLENSTLYFSGLGYEFSENLSVVLPATLVLPTNEDDRDFRSYQGSLIASPSLRYKFTEGLLRNLSLRLDGRYNRSAYEFDTTKGEVYNPESATSLGISAVYSWQKLSFYGGFSNSTVYLADGSQLDDRYAASLSASFMQNDHLSYSFSWSQTDRTFGYGGQGSNISFNYADLTLLTFSMTYSI